MKTKISFLIVAFLALATFKAYSQLTIAQIGNAQCPGVALTHIVTNPVNAACTYDWVVTNGTIQGGTQIGSTSTLNNAGTTVTITWSSSSTSGSISVTAKSCSPEAGNTSQQTLTAPILSLAGVTPGAITGSPGATAVQINSTPNLVFNVPQIQYPSRGTFDPSPYNITIYEWEIPSGWTVVSGGTSNTITVRPDNCSAGSMRARGKASCSNGNFFSNWSAPLAITRTLDTPAAITGPASIDCSDVSTKTYSISAVGGATSYTWTLPSGWTGTSTTTSITLTPNGLNAGTIAVRANGCSIQTAASSLPVVINLSNPANPLSISGPQFVCNSGSSTFTLNNTLPNSTATWSTPSPTYFIGSSSGSGFSANLQAIAAVTAQTSITFNVSTPCGSPPPVTMPFWAGRPGVPTTNPSGVPAVQTSVNGITTVSMVSAPGSTLSSVSWTVSNSSALSVFQQGTSNIVIEARKTGYYFLYARTSNICGLGTFQSIPFNVTSSGGGGPLRLSTFPNPSTDEVTLELDDSIGSQGEAVNIKVWDKFQSVMFEISTGDKTIKIPVQNLPQGIYYLTVNGSKGSHTQRIRVDH